jgi:hypothetical protein
MKKQEVLDMLYFLIAKKNWNKMLNRGESSTFCHKMINKNERQKNIATKINTFFTETTI